LKGRIFIKCWDKDLISDDFLGELSIDLTTMTPNEAHDEWYTLANEPKQKPQDQEPGQIRIKVLYPIAEQGNTQGTTQINENQTLVLENPKFSDLYTMGRELGRGGFSVVYEGIRKQDNVKFAVKVIAKNQSEDELSLLRREIDIMKKLKHEHIISLSNFFEDQETIYLILELASGGELFDQIISRGSYSERDAANIIRQILDATCYMHEKGIAHRDLKPENLLVTGEQNDLIKISDFGLSKDFGKENLKTSCGTPDYVAPEVLRGTSYDHSVDIWSIGVITYILLCGFPPFYGNTEQQIFNKILRAEYDFPSPDWDHISEEAKEFIKALLVLNPNDRPSAKECIESPWITNKSPSGTLTRLDSLKSGMSEYNEKRKKTK